jgi:hypothetical protein
MGLKSPAVLTSFLLAFWFWCNSKRKLHWYYYSLITTSSNWFIVGSILQKKVDFQNLLKSKQPACLYCTADTAKSPALPFIPKTFDISYHRFSVVKLMTYIPSTLTPPAFTFPFNTESWSLRQSCSSKKHYKSSLNPTIILIYISQLTSICKVS